MYRISRYAMTKNEKYKFYEEIMTYAIRYGVARTNWGKTRSQEDEEVLDSREAEMRGFIKSGLNL